MKAEKRIDQCLSSQFLKTVVRILEESLGEISWCLCSNCKSCSFFAPISVSPDLPNQTLAKAMYCQLS